MIDKVKAFEIINTYLLRAQQQSVELEIQHSEEYSKFWFFNYNASEYLRNDNISYALAGNRPLLVDKSDGTLYALLEYDDIRFTFEEIMLMSAEKLLYFDLILKIED